MEKQHIFITGASSGIGKSIALHLHKIGHTVLGTSRTPQKHKSKLPFKLLALDITDEQSVKNCYKQLRYTNQHLDVLINNAGSAVVGAIEESSIAQSKLLFELNFWGLVQVNKQFLPLLRENGGGKIIHIASLAGMIGVPFQGFYSASKHAMEGYVKSLKYELRSQNIEVCSIEPNFTKSNLHHAFQNADTPLPMYSPMKKQMENYFHEAIETGASPIVISKKIEKLIQKRSLKNSYPIGISTRILPLFNYLFPNIYYTIANRVFGIKEVK